MRDFFVIFYWWSLLFGLGIISLPLVNFLFKKFFDKGYLFAKILSILILGYSLWLLASFQILPFSQQSIWLLILIFFIGCFAFNKKYFSQIKDFFKENKKIIIFEELLFFFSLLFWSFVRGFEPQIKGLEKFMDFGFLNAILRSKFFPPYDMWMAGKTINYYYFGHYIAAFLTKLSGINSAITYNLMIATIFAFAFSFSFSLVLNLIFNWRKEKKFSKGLSKSIIILSLLGAFLVTLSGNLHTLYWFLTNNFSFKNYWYPDATRFIDIKFGAKDNTIHEFPAYSFVVSDLHGHFNNLPFTLFFIVLLFAFILAEKEKQNHYLPLISLTLAVMLMTNSWDFPIYFLLLGFSLLLLFSFSRKIFYFGGASLILALIFASPFLANFDYPGGGIDFVKARTPFLHLLVLWGYQSLFAVSFFIFLIFKKLFPKTNYQLSLSEFFILILCLTAFVLIFIPEVIYLKDIYGIEYHRSNTMFKLVYQAFIFFSLSISFILFLLWNEMKKLLFKVPLFSLFIFCLIFVGIYPYFAIKSYYGSLKELRNYEGLYGLNFLVNFYPDDYQAILWLKENVKNSPGVLEAAGDSFTDFNRVSAVTGLPTIQGWLVHEWLWRGSFDEVSERAEIVQRIYETNSVQEAFKLLSQYQMKYVFIGAKEREKYSIFEDKFSEIGKIVFQSGSTKIYKINL